MYSVFKNSVTKDLNAMKTKFLEKHQYIVIYPLNNFKFLSRS